MPITNQNVGQIERATQNRIVALFRNRLNYEYLGNWEDRPDNSNIEEGEARKYLSSPSRGYSATLITRALDQLRNAAKNYSESLYTNNQNVYKLLRYGAKVVEQVGENNQDVYFIDWKNPEKNNFAIAEEVTIHGNREKRPDIVLYVNGIALGVLELKRSVVSVGDGIRQSIVNQKKEFIQSFFSTIQFVFAGNNTEGLRYGTNKMTVCFSSINTCSRCATKNDFWKYCMISCYLTVDTRSYPERISILVLRQRRILSADEKAESSGILKAVGRA
jgi:type I restriction enzyme R subunit